MGVRVLLIDDDQRLIELLASYLEQNGVTVTGAPDGARGLAALEAGAFDAVLLDVMMPGMTGLEACKRIRQKSKIPIIMLTAKGDETDRVVGLEIGADDYVAKPFELEELIARLHTALRRPRLESRPTLTYADLTVDVSRRAVYRGDKRVELSAREFDLLVTFLRSPERVFSRTELLDAVWGVDRDLVPNTVETYISYLRAKLDSGEAVKLIQTLRGVGYALRATPR